MRRHKEFKLWKDKPQEKARITAESNAIISQWFYMLKETYEEYSIQPDDFWNYDESGIICGLGGDEYVITLTPRQVVSSKHFNRELITMGECISAAGEVIPPLLIIKKRWVSDTRWHKRNEFESRGRQGALRVGGMIKAKDGRLIAQERIDERETLKNNKKLIREEKQIQQENRRLREKKKLLNIQKEKEKK